MPSSTSSKLANIRQRLIQILASLPLDPVITGSLLLALTRGSPKLQSTLLRPFDNNILSKNRATRLATAVTILKVLFSLGLINRINKFLNYCAFNNWYIHPNRRPGPAWQFGGVGDKEIVLITGGCSGIGAQLVRDFAGKAKIVVVDISDLPEEFKTIPNIHHYHLDLNESAETILATSSLIISEVGAPSVLINNAGIGNINQFILTADPASVSKLIHINLISHFTLIRAFVPEMVKAQKGHIVTIASAASYFSVAGMADYAATKAGVLALHEALTQELRHIHNAPGVLTTIVHPGWTDTAIVAPSVRKQLRKVNIPLQPPSEVTSLIVNAVVKGRGARLFVPGKVTPVSWVRGLPFWIQDAMRSGASGQLGGGKV